MSAWTIDRLFTNPSACVPVTCPRQVEHAWHIKTHDAVATSHRVICTRRRPGTDSELRVRLSRLTFRAHRPTVAALMALGLDFSLATDPLTPSPFSPATTSQREVAAPGGRTAQSGEEGGESDSESDVSSVAGDEARQVAAAGADGENRVMMRLVLEMEKLEVSLVA